MIDGMFVGYVLLVSQAAGSLDTFCLLVDVIVKIGRRKIGLVSIPMVQFLV